MKNITTLAAGLVLSSALFAGCNGGGGGSAAPPNFGTPGGGSTPVPTSAPSSAPTGSPAAGLSTAGVNGTPGFVTTSGMATYTFDGDTVANQSACTGGCLAVWPAVPAPSGTLSAPWSAFVRGDDGVHQIAYNGKPLYTFVNDSTPGVATGDGVDGFHIARPAAATPAPTPSATPTPPGYTPGALHRRLPH